MADMEPGGDAHNELIDICVEYGIDSPKKLNMLRVGEALKKAFYAGEMQKVYDLAFWSLNEKDMEHIINSLSDTSGRLVKDSELKYWIEHFVQSPYHIK